MGPRGFIIATCLIVVSVIAAVTWGTRDSARVPHLSQLRANTTPARAALSTPSSVPSRPLQDLTSTRNPSLSLRSQLRLSRDYASLVRDLAAAVAAGDTEAEYVSAKALRYCNENLKRFFRLPDGKLRSLAEAQSRWATRPAGYQAEIVDVYDRCHAYLDDSVEASKASSWKALLEQAANGGHPAAEAESSDLLRAQALLNGGVVKSDGEDKSLTLSDLKNLAVSSAESGDPDALMIMSDWVDSKSRTPEEYGDLVSAWQIVACQHGYDCDASSEWMRSQCNYDPQCASADTYVDYFRRHLGSRFDEVLNLATQISGAIASRDSEAIQTRL